MKTYFDDLQKFSCLSKGLLLVFLLINLTGFANAQTLTVVSWNIESGGATDTAVAARIREFQDVDVWGFSEVASDTALQSTETAAEHNETGNPDFRRILGQTGNADRLGIVYNATRFTLVRSDTVSVPGASSGQRAPLFAELKENASNKSFIFMINHLARGDAGFRRQQAIALNTWVRTQTLPVLAVGDYNFDFNVEGGDQPGGHDQGFDNMIVDNVWRWVKPPVLVKSQCSPNFNSVLDFVFANNLAQNWRVVRSEILVKANDCVASPENPDHRPVIAVFEMGQAGGSSVTKTELLRRIELLEQQLRELKQLVLTMPNN